MPAGDQGNQVTKEQPLLRTKYNETTRGLARLLFEFGSVKAIRGTRTLASAPEGLFVREANDNEWSQCNESVEQNSKWNLGNIGGTFGPGRKDAGRRPALSLLTTPILINFRFQHMPKLCHQLVGGFPVARRSFCCASTFLVCGFCNRA